MKKSFVLSVVAALAIAGAAPAFAADMPVKAAPAPAAAPMPFDVLFGTAVTSDYILRGISQSNRKPAIQGYFEGDYTVTPWLTLYSGVWGSSLYTGFANAEFDISGGARFSYNIFGLDVGYVYYAYPGPAAAGLSGNSSISYGEFYGKPSVKVTDWLTLAGSIYGGSDFGHTGQDAVYYSGSATVTLPQFLPLGIGTSLSAEVGHQTYSSGYKALGTNVKDYTQWNAGVDFNYKAITLDLRYYDTDLSDTNSTQCISTTNSNLCKAAFVAMLKFDTALSALK